MGMGEILSIRHQHYPINQSYSFTYMYGVFIKMKNTITINTFYFIDDLLTKVFFTIFYNPSMLTFNISENSKHMHMDLN